MTERQDLRFMQEALKLSERGRRLAPPNPSVGCVIVRAGEVIASGYTQPAKELVASGRWASVCRSRFPSR